MSGAAVGENQFGIPVEAVIVGSIVVAATPNRSAVSFRTVTVVTSGTPVQGPSVTVPDGFSVAVKNRITNAGSPTGFVANTSGNTANATVRTEMLKGEAFAMFEDNYDNFFFDASLDGTIFELFSEL